MSLLDKFKKATDAVLHKVQEQLETRNAVAQGILQKQIDSVAANARRKPPLRTHIPTLSNRSAPLQNHALAVNAALTLYPNTRTTLLIKQFQTASGNKLIEESGLPDGRKKLAVWNEKTKTRDILEEIYTESGDNGSAAQFTSYYNAANRSISINYAGTVFTNIDDLMSVSQTVSESVSMRMTRVKECLDNMISTFNKLHPGQLEKTSIDICAHSAGANSIPLTNYFLQRQYGIVPRSQIMIEPYGAKNSFEAVAGMIAQAEHRDSAQVLAELSQNTITFKSSRHTLVDGLKNLNIFSPSLGNSPATIGTVKLINVGGNSLTAHQIRTWVKYFNTAELRDAQKSPRRFVKKPIGKPPR